MALSSVMNLDSTLGALLLGLLASTCLWGVSCSQIWRYFSLFPHDPIAIKCLVSIAWCIDTTQLALVCHLVYHYLVSSATKPLAILFIVPSMKVQLLLLAHIALLVNCFYTYRVWRMSNRNIPLTIFLLSLVLGTYVLLVLFCARFMHFRTWLDKDHLINDLMPVIAGITTGSDLCLAAAMSVYLWRGRTSVSSTRAVLNRLMLYAVSTGLLTTFIALGSFIAYMTAPTTFIFMALLFVEARLYVIAMILSLNLRAFLRDNSAARAAAGTTIELDTDVNHSHSMVFAGKPTSPDLSSMPSLHAEASSHVLSQNIV